MDRLAEFGERVLWFVPAKQRAKLEPRWRNVAFLGRAWGSDQNYVGILNGSVAEARARVRVVPGIRWDAARLKHVTGTLLDLNTTVQDTIEESSSPHRCPDGHREDGVDVDDLGGTAPK